MNPNHSPLPPLRIISNVTLNGFPYAVAVNPEGKWVALLLNSREEEKERAQYIVTAANNHEKLVGALTSLLADAEVLNNTVCHGQSHYVPNSFNQARQALEECK